MGRSITPSGIDLDTNEYIINVQTLIGGYTDGLAVTVSTAWSSSGSSDNTVLDVNVTQKQTAATATKTGWKSKR